MSDTKPSNVKPGRMMKATHTVQGTELPVTCDSVDNLLVIAEKRVRRLATVNEQMEAALRSAEKSIIAFMGTTQTPNESGAGAILAEVRSALKAAEEAQQ